MRIRIFTNNSAYSLQEEINDWLEVNDVEVTDMRISSHVTGNYSEKYIFAILYKEKE